MPRIGIGLWAIGGSQWGSTDDGETLHMIDSALEKGVRFFDTADVYGDGHSEELLGRAMVGRREKFLVGTKIGWVGFQGDIGSSAYTTTALLIEGVESNLRRLKTDYIDLLQSHINFRDPTMEVFLEGFEILKKQGKIRAYGVSTSDFDYLQAFNQNKGCSTLQVDYSILNRTPEADCLPYCQEHGIETIIRGGLAMGILTDKFTPQTTFEDNDFRKAWISDPDQNRIFLQDLKTVEQLRAVLSLGPPGQTMGQLAIRFLLANPGVTTVIPGGKNARQLTSNLAVLDMPPLSKEEMKAIDKIVPPKGGRKIWPA